MGTGDALEAPRLNLRQKLCRIMGELGYVEKRGRNTFSNYDYVTAADVAAVLRQGPFKARRSVHGDRGKS